MNFEINSIWTDWRLKVPNGVPNPFNDYHLVLLKEICFKHSVDQEIIDSVILFLEAKEKSKYTKASGGKYYVKNKETGNVYTVVKPNPEKHDPISREKAEKEVEKDSEEKEEPKGEEKESIEDKLKGQKERYEKLGLDEKGVPTKKPENPDLDEIQKPKIDKGLDKLNEAVSESTVIPEEDKQNISSAIDKIKNGQVDEMTDDEITALRTWVAVKDQTGQTDPSKRSVEFYLADVRPKDWRFGATSVGKGQKARQARKKVSVVSSGNAKLYDELQKVRESVGLKSASPTNARTTSKVMAPTTINKKRKQEKITSKKDSEGNVTEATIAGQTHTKKSVPKLEDVKKALIDRGMSEEDAARSARSVVLGIKRYNDQIDLLAEAEEDLEVVDYGDLSTHEGRQSAINQCLQDIANGLEQALERTTPPHPPLTREHYELMEYIRNIKNPLDDPDWESLSFEEQQKRANQFNEEMGEILVKMNALGDIDTSRAEVAESITFMHRASQGFNSLLPSSETFKVTDVWALKDPGDTNDPKKIAESIQKILVSVEVSGGESVKYDKGARSSSAGKVALTVYKNKKTRSSINSLLDTYDKIYKGDDYPPSKDVLDELDKVKDDVKSQVVNDGIMTEEEFDEIYEAGKKTGETAFESFLRKNRSKLAKAGFTDEDLELVKESFIKHCGHGKVMAAINNKDTEYNKFNNVSHKVSAKGYKVVEADGVDVISGMDFSCDQGFNIADPPKKKISPENTNPSAIVPIDSKTGDRIK